MKNGESIFYKGKKITKENDNNYVTTGTWVKYPSLEDVKKDIDYTIIEDEALENIYERQKQIFETEIG